ncbi:MAG: hypothetical protein OEV57_03595 [Dehalococcoidia bacterium]|nr:hypothetical protein [Dehalococcoidia bacterium]
MPECVGNIAQQILPKGIVCDGCNNRFGGGKGLEAALIDEPIFSTLVAVLGLRDIGSQFTYQHSPSGAHRACHIAAEVSASRIVLTTQYEIQGQPNKPNEVRTISKCKDYRRTDLAFLSRAIHKIAFETLAHHQFVGTGIRRNRKELGDIDVFDREFDVIRTWVRRGEPQSSVRPALRIQRFDQAKTKEQLSRWGGEAHYFRQGILYALNLFNDWYIVSLTSPPDRVENDLRSWRKTQEFPNTVWMVGDRLHRAD